MVRYVAGFMFGHAGSRVALIKKLRPEWQAGKFNGIGWHIEKGESPEEAMVREFREETGLETSEDSWVPFAVLSGEDWRVYFFFTYGELELLNTTTDEEILLVPVSEVTVFNSIPNLTWLLPLAKSTFYDKCKCFDIKEMR